MCGVYGKSFFVNVNVRHGEILPQKVIHNCQMYFLLYNYNYREKEIFLYEIM